MSEFVKDVYHVEGGDGELVYGSGDWEAAPKRTVVLREASIELLKGLEKALDDIASNLNEDIAGLAADVSVINEDIEAQAEEDEEASGGKSASDETPEANE